MNTSPRDIEAQSDHHRDAWHDVASDDSTVAGVVPTKGASSKAERPFTAASGETMTTDPHVVNSQQEEVPYHNWWFSFRTRHQVYLAELLGTLILVVWGEGTQAQVLASRQQPGDYLSIAWGWGVGFMLAVYVSSGISGGHVNPAVTISLAVFRKFPWRKVPAYIFAQLLGAFLGAGIVYGNYYGSFAAIKNGTISVMVTGPAALVPNTLVSFFSIFTGAALLMGAISAFTDTENNPVGAGLVPLLLGLIMVGIASAFGYSTGFVLNPARDLGPRFFLSAIGFNVNGLWTSYQYYGIWAPSVGTITGALFGNFFYDLLVYRGKDSPVNMNFSREGRRITKERQRAAHDAIGQQAAYFAANYGGGHHNAGLKRFMRLQRDTDALRGGMARRNNGEEF